MRRNFSEIVEVAGTACKPFDGSRKYISTGSVHHDSICDNEVEIVNFKNKPSRANLEVNAGDILFAKMQGTRKTLLIDEDLSRNIYSTGFYAIKPKSGVITEKCLYYLVDSSLFLGEKDKKCSGATQKAINNYGLKQIELKIPNYHNQAKIGEQLDLLFSMIRARRHQINQLDNLIKARFVEMFGERKNRRTLQEFSIGKSGYGAASTSVSYDPTRPRYVRITDINDDGTLNNDFVCSINKQDDINYKLEKGDFLFARMGATVGKTYYYKGGSQIYAGYLIRFKLDPEKLLPEYLYTYTQTEEYLDWVKLNQSGAAQPGINAQKYSSLQIPVASIEEQKEFVRFVSQVDKSKFAVQESLEKTQQLFDSLMQEYFG